MTLPLAETLPAITKQFANELVILAAVLVFPPLPAANQTESPFFANVIVVTPGVKVCHVLPRLTEVTRLRVGAFAPFVIEMVEFGCSAVKVRPQYAGFLFFVAIALRRAKSMFYFLLVNCLPVLSCAPIRRLSVIMPRGFRRKCSPPISPPPWHRRCRASA